MRLTKHQTSDILFAAVASWNHHASASCAKVFKFDPAERKWKDEILPPQIGKTVLFPPNFTSNLCIKHRFLQVLVDGKIASMEGRVHDIAWAPQTGFCFAFEASYLHSPNAFKRQGHLLHSRRCGECAF